MSMGQECKYVVRKNSGVEPARQVICSAKMVVLPSQKREERRQKEKKRNNISKYLCFAFMLRMIFFDAALLFAPSSQAR